MITRALYDLPSDLYVNSQCEDCYSESEPEAETCETCNGSGHIECGPKGDTEEYECDYCNGRGGFDPPEYWHFDRSDLKVAIVGKELASYV
jgi:hypothetical protein